jgi:dihydrofolate reductase
MNTKERKAAWAHPQTEPVTLDNLGAPSGKPHSLHVTWPTRLSLVVAMAKNRVIGRDNATPWHLPAELKLFKTLTMGHAIIMGRKTYESIGRLLPGRTSIIVTRRLDYRIPGAIVVHSLGEAISACGDDPEVFVIGGAEIFREALPLADRIYLTLVQTEVVGDTLFPEFDLKDWKEIGRESHLSDRRNAYDFDFIVYERV